MAGKPITKARKAAAEKRKALTGSTRKPRVAKPVAPEVKKARADGTAIFGFPAAAWELFLKNYMLTCHQQRSANAAGIPLSAICSRRADDGDFENAFEKARKVAFKRLEDEGMRRAVEGVEEPIFYKGEEVGTVQRYSDGLLSFMLQANDERYRKQSELNLKGGLKLDNLTDAELDAMQRAKEAELKALEDNAP